MGSIVYKAELDQLEYTQIYTVYVIQTQPACINSPAIHEQSYSKRRSGRPYSPEKQRRQFVLPSDFILVLCPTHTKSSPRQLNSALRIFILYNVYTAKLSWAMSYWLYCTFNPLSCPFFVNLNKWKGQHFVFFSSFRKIKTFRISQKVHFCKSKKTCLLF